MAAAQILQRVSSHVELQPCIGRSKLGMQLVKARCTKFDANSSRHHRLQKYTWNIGGPLLMNRLPHLCGCSVEGNMAKS